MKGLRIAAVGLALVAAPVLAGNKLIPAGQPVAVAKSVLTVTPSVEWNKLGARPGRNSGTGTFDGRALNDLTVHCRVGSAAEHVLQS